MVWGWKQAIGMQALATVPVNIFSGDTIVALCHYGARSQEPGFDRRRHLAWVGEEDAGEIPCGAHSAWKTAVAGRRLHTVRSVPECFRTTFPVFTWSTALVSPSGWP